MVSSACATFARWYVFHWARLRSLMPSLADPSANASEFINAVGTRRRSYWKLLAVLVGLAMLVGPWFYSRLMARANKRTRVRRRDTLGSDNDNDVDGGRDARNDRNLVPGEADTMPVSRFFECVNDYEALSNRELSLRRGDIVHVAARVGQRWLAVERRDGARGLVPTTVMRPYDEHMRRYMPPGSSPSSGRRHNRHHRRSTLRASQRRHADDVDDEEDDDDNDNDDGGKTPVNSRSRSAVAMTREEAARFAPRATSDRDVATSGGGRQRRPFSDEELEWWADQRR